MKNKVVIIGGVAGGTSTGAAAKRVNPDLEIRLFDSRPHISVGACSFPYYIGDLVKDEKALYHFTPDSFQAKKGVEVFAEHRVTDIDFNKREITVKDIKQDRLFRESWDILVISTGASPFRLPVPGRDSIGIFNLKFFEDAVNIKKFMKNEQVKDVVIVGGGNIGLELAENFSNLGLDTVIVEKMNDVIFSYEPEIIEVVRKKLKEKGVKIFTETTAEAYQSENGKVTGVKTDQGEFKADMVIESIGIRPNNELYKDAGFKMLKNGALVVNQKSQVEDQSNIYSAGDCASVKNLITGKDDYFPLGTTANKQGRVAGNNIGGILDKFPGTVRAQVFKLFELEVGKTGFTEKEALDLGYSVKSATMDLINKSSAFEGSGIVRIKLIADKETDNILGCSMAGIEGVAKRLDVFSVMISAGMTLKQARYLDLNYSPPFSTVWDISSVIINKI